MPVTIGSLNLGNVRTGGSGGSGFTVFASDGTSYSPSRTVFASDGTSYAVSGTVLSSDGTSYSPV